MAAPTEKTLPNITIFPDLKVIVRTPAGREYRGEAIQHDSRDIAGEQWYQIVHLTPVGKDNQHENAVLRQKFDKDGRPAYFPERSTAEPLKLNLNRIPRDRRHARNADTLIGRFWDADGLWVVLARPAAKSEKVLFAGSLLPDQVEINRGPESKISQYRQATRPGDTPVEVAEFPESQRPQQG